MNNANITIIERLKSRGSGLETDIRLIRALQDTAARNRPTLSPTDRHTVRQGLDAVTRLGAKLVQQGAVAGASSCTVFPRNSPTTRLRTAPRRLRLTFAVGSASNPDGAASSVTLVLTADDLTVSLQTPAFATPQDRKATMKQFRRHAPDVARALRQSQSDDDDAARTAAKGWTLSHGTSSRQPDQCNTDLNDWLASRNAAKAPIRESLKFEKTVPYDELTADVIRDTLTEVCTTFQPFLSRPAPATAPQTRPALVAKGPHSVAG